MIVVITAGHSLFLRILSFVAFIGHTAFTLVLPMVVELCAIVKYLIHILSAFE